MTKLLIENQSYLIYLAGVMIVSGLIKEHGLFANFYNLLIKKIKSKRALLIMISGISGILPIPGRVTLSAGILNTIATNDRKSRSKFGLIDYLSTHHYYLWSPVEKTVIIPMAVLGLGYLEFLKYSAPLLIISIVYIYWYIFTKIDKNDIYIDIKEYNRSKQAGLLPNILPFTIGVLLLILGFPGYIIFILLALYYALITSNGKDYKKIFGYINFRLIFFLAIVIISGNFVKEYYKEIETFLSGINLDINRPTGLFMISILAFGSAFILGSSSKFAGLMAILASIYGVEYLTFFMALEFSGYLMSPIHKCVSIGRMYFGTPFKVYAGVISGWCILMISYSFISISI